MAVSKNKNILQVLISIFIMLSVMSCDHETTTKQMRSYRMPLPDKIQTLNPREVRFLVDNMIMNGIFGQLIGVDRDGYLVPKICYKWEISSDYKEYTFYIRNDIKFRDGIPLTAKDVLFSFEYGGTKPTLIRKLFEAIEGYDEFYEGRSRTIKGITILDDYVVRIRLKKPISTFMYVLASSKLVVLPDKFHGINEKKFFLKPFGAGPYELEKWDASELRLNKVKEYFDNSYNIDEFVFLTMDKASALKAFDNYGVDELVAYHIDPAEIKRTDINSARWNAFTSHLLFFNVNRKPLDNPYLRLAIRAAIDRQRLIDECFPADEVANGIIPRGLVGAIDDVHQFADLNKSVEYYLSKAGFSRKQLPKMKILRFLEMQDSCFKPSIEAMFRKAGLPIEVEYVSFSDGVKKIESNDYYILSEWLGARNVEPISILLFFDGRATHNLSNVNDSEINKLIDIAEMTRTRGGRAEIYRQISEMIVKRAYAVDMQYENKYYVYDKGVNIVGNPTLVGSFEGLAMFMKE